jgi:endonuclease YncB( thermonuclease family)
MKVHLALISLILAATPGLADDSLTGEAIMRDAVTIAISGARIRLGAILPPDETRMCGTANCAEAAQTELASAIKGHTVTCTKHHKLGHGYFLGACTVDGADLGQHLLLQGLALPDAGASQAYRAAADRAKVARRGIWQSGA